MKRTPGRLAPALGAALLLLAGSGCRSGTLPAVRDGFALDTAVSITLLSLSPSSPAASELLDGCFEHLERYEGLFSAQREDSDIGRLNSAGGEPVALAPETFELLEAGLDFGRLTKGALDITIRPASRLWNFQGEPVLPDGEALKAAAALVDMRGLHLADGAARLDRPDAAVDLGGIAKGYIADRLSAYLRENGVTGALIDLGGNIAAVGDKQGADFRIGIRDPEDETRLAAVVPVKNASVVTSGPYERGFTLDGVRYHHILDPATGWPVQNGLASVTIVSEHSIDGDALSTACFVLGEEQGLALVESLPGVEALFIREGGGLAASSGLLFTVPSA